jgi:hypothetical protein
LAARVDGVARQDRAVLNRREFDGEITAVRETQTVGRAAVGVVAAAAEASAGFQQPIHASQLGVAALVCALTSSRL